MVLFSELCYFFWAVRGSKRYIMPIWLSVHELNIINNYHNYTPQHVHIPYLKRQSSSKRSTVFAPILYFYFSLIFISVCVQWSPYMWPPSPEVTPLIGQATTSENKLCIIVSTIPLTRGAPSSKAIFSILQWWSHKRGTTVMVKAIFVN